MVTRTSPASSTGSPWHAGEEHRREGHHRRGRDADLPGVGYENHLKKVPVLDEGQVVGVINRSDITHLLHAAVSVKRRRQRR